MSDEPSTPPPALRLKPRLKPVEPESPSAAPAAASPPPPPAAPSDPEPPKARLVVSPGTAEPAAVVEQKGLAQVSDAGAVEAAVDKVLAANPGEVEKYRGGKTALMGFFVGHVMREMKGKGNPAVVNEVLRQKLEGA